MDTLRQRIFTWTGPPEVYVPKFDPATALGLLLDHGVDRVEQGVLVGMSPTFRPIADLLSNKLRRITVSNLELDETLDLSASYIEEWDHWLSILHAWAEQVCFLPGAQCDFAMGLSTDFMGIKHVGMAVELVLSNLPQNKTDRDKNRTWRWQKGYIGEKYDTALHKSCACLWFQLPPEAVDWDELQSLIDGLDSRRIVQPAHPLEHLLYLIGLRCYSRSTPYAVLSDGEVSFFMDVETTEFLGAPTSVKIFCERIPKTTYPVAYLLCATIAGLSNSLEDPKVDTLGVLNREPPKLLEGHYHRLQRFRDFDAYHLVRNREYYSSFLLWREQACARAVASRPSVGTILSVNCTAPIPRQLFPWRCYEAYQSVPLPEEMLRSVCSVRRPRNFHAANAVKSVGCKLAFEIVEVKQEGRDKWSQVYVGKLCGSDRQSSGLLCLKVFDERCFPVPSLEIFDAYENKDNKDNKTDEGDNGDKDDKDDKDKKNNKGGEVNHDRARVILARLHHADAMLRREEATYHRLADYQGALIPHFYGCHEVELPGGYKAYGILMEYIDGKPLGNFMDEQSIDSWPHDEQVNFYKRVRKAVRLLNASHVSQRDWHANQILLLPRRRQVGRGGRRADEADLVLIDFAFSSQPWCQKHILPEKRDTPRLAFELGMSEEMKKAAGWLPEQCEDYEL